MACSIADNDEAPRASESNPITGMSGHSIIRGFGLPSCYRSQPNLCSEQTSILKASSRDQPVRLGNRRPCIFRVYSSEEENSSEDDELLLQCENRYDENSESAILDDDDDDD